jgi:hypothetical protein
MLGGLERNAAAKRKGRKVLLLRHAVGESRFHVRFREVACAWQVKRCLLRMRPIGLVYTTLMSRANNFQGFTF